jgi:hypothetical protein
MPQFVVNFAPLPTWKGLVICEQVLGVVVADEADVLAVVDWLAEEKDVLVDMIWAADEVPALVAAFVE